MAEALYRIRRAERLTGQANLIMIKDLAGVDSDHDPLKRYSYRPVDTEPNMVLEIPARWKNYDDYLGALDAIFNELIKRIL